MLVCVFHSRIQLENALDDIGGELDLVPLPIAAFQPHVLRQQPCHAVNCRHAEERESEREVEEREREREREREKREGGIKGA